MENNSGPVKKKRGRKPKQKVEITEPIVPIIKKKRGRKPNKLKLMLSDTNVTGSETGIHIPKKRGRKPKTKFEVVQNDNFNSISNTENVILHLPINIETIEKSNDFSYNSELSEPSPFNPFENKNVSISQKSDDLIENSLENDMESLLNEPVENQINIKITEMNNEPILLDKNKIKNNEDFEEMLEELHKRRDEDINTSMDNDIRESNLYLMYDFIEHKIRETWPSSTNIDCLWCCHDFSGIPYGLPIKKENDTFIMFGNFCSPECTAAYNFDSKENDSTIWERYSLINLLYSNNKSSYIKIAIPRLSLKKFGGPFTIDKFRELSGKKNYKVTLPPMVAVIPSLEEIIIDTDETANLSIFNNDFLKKSNTELRLKRTKPLPNFKNTLENCMNLKYV